MSHYEQGLFINDATEFDIARQEQWVETQGWTDAIIAQHGNKAWSSDGTQHFFLLPDEFDGNRYSLTTWHAFSSDEAGPDPETLTIYIFDSVHQGISRVQGWEADTEWGRTDRDPVSSFNQKLLEYLNTAPVTPVADPSESLNLIPVAPIFGLSAGERTILAEIERTQGYMTDIAEDPEVAAFYAVSLGRRLLRHMIPGPYATSRLSAQIQKKHDLSKEAATLVLAIAETNAQKERERRQWAALPPKDFF